MSRDNQARQLSALQTMAIELMNAQNLRDTLTRILSQSMDLLSCDAGSLYLKHNSANLSVEIAFNKSVLFDFHRHLVPLSGRGLAVYAFKTKEALVVKDVYRISPNSPFQFDPSFDEKAHYRTRSVLVQPLVNTRGEALGVLQLINRKNSPKSVWPSAEEKRISQMPTFSQTDQRLAHSLSSLASAAIEKAQLYQNIRELFEGFVMASVKAIESRDPETRGHSERVARLTLRLAESAHASSEGRLKWLRFTPAQLEELRFAALLHDFGKIGVREATLLKEAKLDPMQWQSIQHRMQLGMAYFELNQLRSTLKLALSGNPASLAAQMQTQEQLIKLERERQNATQKLIQDLNKPGILKQDLEHLLQDLRKASTFISESSVGPLLNEQEVAALSIAKGSLSPEERLEIESHVTKTYEFLKDIPWSADFSQVPEIAYAHHEKLNGTGYPRGIAGELIPVQSRIMTICDIFDALVSPDRPYKKGVSLEKALDILHMEAKAGKLDSDLLSVFVENKVFEETLDELHVSLKAA